MKRRGRSATTGVLVSVAAVALMAVLGALAEFGARRLRPESCAHAQRKAEMVSVSIRFIAPCFVSEVRGGEEVLVASDDTNRDATAIPRRRTAGVPRIAVVGESSARLLGEHLSRIAAAPGCAELEVLNCAQPGSALEHVDRRFDEVLAYAPDAIVVLFGHNLAFQFETDERKLRLLGLLSRSCVLSALAPTAPPPDAPWLDARLGAFERFLRGAAARARGRDVVLALATTPANLWIPPASGTREEEDLRFLQVRFLDAIGRSAEAGALLESLARDETEPYWHFQLGARLARAGGAGDRARQELHRARDEDSLRTRAPGTVSDLLRRVSAEEGLLVYDAERDVESRAPGGLPGWETFVDNCHLLPDEFDREAMAIVSLLRGATRLPPSCDPAPTAALDKGLGDVLVGVFDLTSSGPPDFVRLWYEGLALAVESWLARHPAAADLEVNAFLEGEAFAAARGTERHTRMLLAVAEGYSRAGMRDRARELNARAREAGGAEPWVAKGLVDLRDGQPAAARRAFERALALDESRQDARNFARWLSNPPAPIAP